jgi:hypothetical protein
VPESMRSRRVHQLLSCPRVEHVAVPAHRSPSPALHMNEVGCELGIVAATFPPDLPDDKLGVSFDQELPDPQGQSRRESKDQGLILRHVVGGLKVEVHHVLQLLATWVDEDHASPCSLAAGGPVKEECPVGSGEHRSPDLLTWGVGAITRTPRDAWRWRPLRDKVSKDLALDGIAWLEVELESSEFNCPLGDVACGVEIVEDGPQWVGGYHHDLVGLEVVAEFPVRNEYSIKKLMRLRIPGLCLMKHLTDVVDRLLDGPDSASRSGSFCLSWGPVGPHVA